MDTAYSNIRAAMGFDAIMSTIVHFVLLSFVIENMYVSVIKVVSITLQVVAFVRLCKKLS